MLQLNLLLSCLIKWPDPGSQYLELFEFAPYADPNRGQINSGSVSSKCSKEIAFSAVKEVNTGISQLSGDQTQRYDVTVYLFSNFVGSLDSG